MYAFVGCCQLFHTSCLTTKRRGLCITPDVSRQGKVRRKLCAVSPELLVELLREHSIHFRKISIEDDPLPAGFADSAPDGVVHAVKSNATAAGLRSQLAECDVASAESVRWGCD